MKQRNYIHSIPRIAICLIFSWLLLPAIAQEPGRKIERYHAALLKRPGSDTLFSRFFDAWLEDHSIEELEKFLSRSDKSSVPDKMLLGRFYLRQGKDGKAGEALRKAIADPGATVKEKTTALIALSEVLSRDMDFQAALSRIKEARIVAKSAGGSDPDQLKDLGKREGRLLIKLDRRQEGLRAWKELLEQHPEDRFLQEDVVSLLADEGLFDEAIAEQKKAILQSESGKDVYAAVLAKVELGQIHRRANNWREATRVWQSALPATGNDTWLEREILGLIEASFRRSDDLRGLRSAIEEMINVEPKRLSLQIAQARLFADLREDAAAIEQWKHILELTPGNTKLRIQYIETLANLERPGDAAEQLKNLITLEPDDHELLFQLAELQFEAEQFEQSGKSLLAYLDKSDGSEYSHLRVARTLSRYELPAAAKSVFEKLVSRFPESTGASDAFAMFLYDHDEKTAALDRWKTLATTGDALQVLQVVQQLSHRFESAAAFQLLEQRLPDFRKNFRYLREFCETAIIENKAATAFPFALQAVEMSTIPSELEESIKMALRVTARLDKGLEEALSRTANSETINQKCFYASCLAASGNYREAINLLEKLAGTGETDSALLPLLTLKQIHRAQDSWTDAASTLEKIVTKTPGGRKSGYVEELITLYERALKPLPALRWTREWKQIAPGNHQPWLRESEMLEKAGRINEALQVIQDAGRRFEKENTIQVRLADMYSEAGYPREAERVLWRLYENTEDEWARQSWITELARISRKNGRIDFIIRELQQRRRNNSQSLTPILSLAEVYRIAQRDKEYRETLLAATTLEPDNIHLVHRIVDLDLNEGNYSAAQNLLEGIKARDSSGRTINRMARLHMMTGNLAKALQIVSQLPSGKKPSGREIKSMALTAMTFGEWQAAADFLFPRLVDHPDDAEMHYMHAVARLESGNKEAAKTALLALFSFPINHPPQPNPNPNLAYYRQIKQVLPGNRINKWLQFFNVAENYRKQHNFAIDFDRLLYQLNPDTNRGGSPLPLPATELQLRAFAFSHLLRLEKQDPDRDSLRAKAIAAGLPAREFDLGIIQQIKDPTIRLTETKRLYSMQPDDPDLSLWFVSQTGRTEIESEEALYTQAYDTISRKFGPDIAAYAAFTRGHTEQAMRFVVNLPEIPGHLISYLVAIIQDLPIDQQRALERKFERWQPGTSNENFRYISSLLHYYIANGKDKQWAAFIKRQWNRPQAPAPNHQNNFQLYTYSSGRVEDLALPSLIPGISRLTYLHLFQDPTYKNKKTFPISSYREELEEEPTLHLVLATLADDLPQQKLALSSLEKRVAQPDATISELFLFGHWLTRKDSDNAQIEKGVRDLYRARQLSGDTIFGSLIDSRIVQAATRNEHSMYLRKIGLDAALRIRLDKNVPRWQWEQISEHLITWGHPEKAKRPLQIVSAANKTSSRSGFGVYGRAIHPLNISSYIVVPGTDKVNRDAQRLIGKQKSDAAVRLLSEQLPIHAGKILSLLGESHKRNQFRYLKQTVEKAKLIDRVLEASKPGPDARHLDRARYAAIHDLFGRSEDAAKAYRELLAEQPGHPVLRLRLVHCLADTDTEAAITELQSIAKNDGEVLHNQFVATALLSISQKNTNLYSDSLKLADSFSRFLKDIEPAEIQRPQANSFFQGPNMVLSRLANGGREEKLTIPPLFQNNGFNQMGDPFAGGNNHTGKPENKPELAQILPARYQAYKELSLQMIRLNKQNQANYFSQLSAATINSEEDSVFLLPICWDIVTNLINRSVGSPLLPADTGSVPVVGFRVAPVYHYNSQNNAFLQPVSWLIVHAFETKSPQLVERLITRLEQENLTREIEGVKAISDLYFCEPGSFTDSAAKILNIKPGDPEGQTSTKQPGINLAMLAEPPPGWTHISRARKHRPEVEPHFDAGRLSIQLLRQLGSSSPAPIYFTVARELVAKEGPDALHNYLKEIEKILFEDQDAAEFVAANPVDPKASFYMNTINQLARDRVCCFATCLHAMASDLGTLKSFHPGSQPYFEGYNTSLGDPKLIEFLTHSGLFASLDELETFPRSEFPNWQDNESNSFVSRFLRNLRDRHRGSSRKARREELLQHIEISSPDSNFGRNLVEAMLDEEPAEATVELFSQHLVEIQNLPRKKQIQIARLGRDLFDFNSFSRHLTSDERDTVVWIGQQSGRGAVDELAKFAEATSFSELGARVRSGRLQWNGYLTIRSGLPFDWNKSFAAFENFCVLGEAATQNGILTPQTYTFTSSNLNNVINDHLPVPSFCFYLSLANSPKLKSNFIYRDITDELAKAINEGKASSPTTILGEFFSDVQGQVEIEELDTRIAIPVLYELVRSLNSKSRKVIHEWSQENGTKLLYPVLSKHLRAVNSIFFDRDRGLPDEARIHFETVLAKQTDLDLGPRLLIAELLCDDLYNPPASIVKLSLEALLEGWRANEPVPQHFASEILGAHHTLAGKSDLEWDELEMALGNEFHLRFVSGENPIGQGPARTLIQATNFDRTFLKRMIALQAGQKNYAAANQIITKYQSNLKSDLGNLFAIMIRFGGHEIASRILRTNWKECLERPPSEFRYDQQQAEGLAGFLESLNEEEPWMPILAELLIISMSDPPSSHPRPEGWIARNERQVALAERFRSDDFPVQEMREGAINLLSRSSQAKQILAPLLAEIAKDWTIPMIASESSSTQRRKKIAIYCDFLTGQLRAGNTAKWQQALADAKLISNQSIKRDLIRPLIALPGSNWPIDKIAPEAMAAIPPLIYESLEVDEYRFTRTSLTTLITFHYLSNTEAEFPNYISRLEPKALNKFVKVYRSDIHSSLQDSLRQIKDIQVRVKLLKDAVGEELEKLTGNTQPERIEMIGRRILGTNRSFQIKGPLNLSGMLRQQFLDAESIAETAIAPSSFRSEGLKLMLEASSVSDRRKIYDHTVSLIRKEQQSKAGWTISYWNGWSPAGKLLTEFGTGERVDNWKPLALIADVVWNNPPLDFTYAHSHEFGEQARFDYILERSVGLFRPRETLSEQINLLSKELGDRSNWGPTSVFLPQFHESFDAIGNPIHIIDYIEVADELWDSTKNPMALDFAMAGRMWLEIYHHEYFGSRQLSRPDAWKSHALAALQNPEANLALRLSLARHFLYRARGKCSDDIIRESARILAEGLNSEQQVNGYSIAVVLRAFNQLSDDPEWNHIALRIVEGWHHKSRFDAESTKHGKAFVAVTDAVLAILETILILDDEKELARILAEKEERLKNSPRAFALLVRHQKFDLARKYSKDAFPSWDVSEMEGRFDVRYDRALHEQIPKYLATLSGEEQKYFASLFLYSIPDPLREDDHWYQLHPELRKRLGIDLLPDKVERLAPIAQKTETIEFSSQQSKKHALLLLARDWRLAPHLGSLLEEEFKKSDGTFQKIPETEKNSAGIDPLLLPPLVFAVDRVWQGNPTPFRKLVEQIATSKTSRTTWSRTYSLERCVKVLNDMVEERLTSMNEKQLVSAFEAYATFYSLLGVNTSYDQYGEGIISHIVISGLLKDPTALANWRQQNQNKIENLKSILTSKKITTPHVISRLLHLEGHEDSRVSEEKQWDVVKTLISDPWLQESYRESDSTPLVLHLMQHHCLTPDLVAKFDETIANTWSQNGLASLEIAQFYARQKMPDQAITFARLAVSQIRDHESTQRSTATRVKAAAILRRVGDKAVVGEFLLDPNAKYIYRGRIFELNKELKKEFDLPVIPPQTRPDEKAPRSKD